MTALLENRRALVTGGASGLGRAIALAFAHEGAHVIIADRDGDGARAVVQEIAEAAQTSAAGSAEAWEGDLSDTTALEERFAAQPLDVDILVNNAGIQRIHPVEEFPLDEWRFIQTLMLESPAVLTKGALPARYPRGWGRVINLPAVPGLRASANQPAYVAAKHGLMGLTKPTAREGGAKGATCTAIHPGYVMPPLVEAQVTELA